jgi:hypothetical protein
MLLTLMAKYVTRTCPRCGDIFGVTLGDRTPHAVALPVTGWCTRCGYEIDWKLVFGSGSKRKRFGSFDTEPIKDV